MGVTTDFSGVVINQNSPTTGHVSLGPTFYQNFKLPNGYRLGSEPGQHRYPDLSGFQLLVKIPSGQAAKATINYVLEHHIFGEGWRPLASGTVVGAHTDGEKVWMDAFFEESVPVTTEIAEAELRIKITGSVVSAIWLVEPAITQQPSYKEAELLSSTFNFRVLALTADSGTDFLGNPYRSVAIQQSLENTSTINPHKGYWRSSPQPSKFAVVSNYFDVRFDPGDKFGLVNYISNPNFEYDKVGASPAHWTEYTSEFVAQKGEIKVSEGWANTGKHSLFLKSGNITQTTESGGLWGSYSDPVPFTHPSKEGMRQAAHVNILKLPAGGKIGVFAEFLDAEFNLLSAGGQYATTTGIHELHGRKLIPATNLKVAYIRVKTLCQGAAGVYEWYFDSSMLTREIEGESIAEYHEIPYFDGDSEGAKWLGAKGGSYSVQEIPSTPEEAVVVDGVLLDPQTPNVAFNVYYSSDGEADENTTTQEWDQKLWTRVPRTYVATQRQTYAFPSPIIAKYIKIEYSHLQPQAYNPGDFQKPVIYKKFPKWVASFFLNQLTSPAFIANQVNVAYDALQFAYSYYLDDLHQRPEAPLAPTEENEERIKEFFSQTDASNLVDSETLSKINLILNTFTEPPASLAKDSLLGTQAKRVAQLQTNYPVELEPEQENRNTLAVSSLNRENIVIEESMPVMYFYLTCRHAYKELTATLEYNRAYFVGINEIAFIRNNYTSESDTEVYIESGGDTENLVINDFVINDNGSWSTF
jgi:hypothetical protein